MTRLALAFIILSLSTILSFSQDTNAFPVKLISLADRVRVEIGGQLFTEYVFGDGASRPYCYPVLAADGTGLTRNFPMKHVAGEDTDHPWQRSLWFAHSMVNGVDFWNEGKGDAGHSPKAKGKTVQVRLIEATSGKIGFLRTEDNWLAPDGKIVCTDERTLSFHATAQARMIDYQITLRAPTNTPLVLGDNKDGVMAIRVAQWMTLPHQHHAHDTQIADNISAGHIMDSVDDRDHAVWGKRAD